MRRGRKLDGDRIAGADFAAAHDDRHGAGFADETALRVAVDNSGHEAGGETVELVAGVTQAGDLQG